MNKMIAFAALAALGLGVSACNESTPEDAKDVRASQAAVAKDQAVIDSHNAKLEKNRAAKAAAKSRGDTLEQAKKSVAIGANKAVIGAKKVEKDADKAILEEDKKDLAQ